MHTTNEKVPPVRTHVGNMTLRNVQNIICRVNILLNVAQLVGYIAEIRAANFANHADIETTRTHRAKNSGVAAGCKLTSHRKLRQADVTFRI